MSSTTLQNGDRIHLVDRKGRQYAVTLKAGDIYQISGHKIAHDDLINKLDGSVVHLSGGKSMLAMRPTFGEYVLKMPRGAQVLYPKDLALMTMWADVYPGARVFEAGTGSGALTMALLRAVGPRGVVVTYETREDFARTARNNIERYVGPVPNLIALRKNAYEGIDLLEGKVAIVTGGNAGIGEAVAKRFTDEGAAVVVTGRRQAELERVISGIRHNKGKA